jgi:cytidylate kinase
MSVITISRQFGSGGQEIATRLCDVLGYSFFDKQSIVEAAIATGLSADSVVDYSEQYHKVEGFLQRLAKVMTGAPGKRPELPRVSWGGLEARLDDEWWLELVNTAIRSAYERGDVVIVGRGGQMVLRDHPDVLHVRIEAPLDDRIRRVQDMQGVTASAARRLIDEHDQASARYLERGFKADWDDPYLYHLLINTGRWDLEAAAQLIVEAAEKLQMVHAT